MPHWASEWAISSPPETENLWQNAESKLKSPMQSFYRILAPFIAALFMSACLSPAATSRPRSPWIPTPPEVEQYSDYVVGRYAYFANNPDLAAESAIRATKRAPEQGFLLEHAVALALLAGDAEKAVNLAKTGYKKANEIGPLTILALASDKLRNDRFAEARAFLLKEDLDPFNRMVARSLAAWAATGEGDLPAAKTHIFESFIGDNFYDGINLYMLAFIHESVGDYDEALDVFDAVWTERMRLAIAAEQYARLLAYRGDTDAALEITTQFRQEIGPNPSVDSVWVLINSGADIERRDVSAREGAALSLYALAAALAAQTEAGYASAYFELALYINPDFDLAKSLLGSTLDQADRREEAIDILSEIEPDSAYYASSRGQIAWTLMRMERDEEAIETALEAYTRTEDRDLAVQIGDLHRVIEDHDTAYDWFNLVVEQDEAEGRTDWRSYYARGIASHMLERWEDAEKDFQRAIEIYPDQPEVLNYLGYSWVDRGENLEEAFELIRRAVDLSPRSGHIVDSLGWAYYRLGHYDKAVEHLERAVELTGGDPVINDHLGDAYWRAGRHLQAGFQWKHALRLESDADKKGLIQAKLEHGLDAAQDASLATLTAPGP